MVSLELEARLDNLLATAQEETCIDLFAPILEREECPLCMIQLPNNDDEIIFKPCCGKLICKGCMYKHVVTEAKKGKKEGDHKCAFCGQLTLEGPTRLKSLKKLMKRNIPRAFIEMARCYHLGNKGVIQSDTKSLEMIIRAAELGDTEAFLRLGSYYHQGILVGQDRSKALELYIIAAKKGSIEGHQELAHFHLINGDIQELTKHLKVAASAGDKDSMDELMKMYKGELLSKEDLTQILRAFQASRDELKSKDRENARLIEECRKRGEAPPRHLFL